ncbi:MAG: cyclase family protein [Culicoidibacterales bacterium]
MKLIDLTHSWDQPMSNYPGDPHLEQQPVAMIATDGYHVTQYQIHSHLGTHLDAPKHILADGKTTADYPLTQFCGLAYVVEMPTQDELLTWINEHEQAIQRAEIVLVKTNWSKFYGTTDYLVNYPVLPWEAVEWLSGQNLKIIGIDAPSFDAMTSETLPNHHCLLAADSLLIENLTHLSELPAWCDFSAYPLPIASDGSPVRAIARIEIL